MNLGKIYETVIREGIEADPRGKTTVQETLKKTKEDFDALSPKEKEAFDREKLTNPYEDTRILYGGKEVPVKTAIVGIDVDTSELLLTDRLNAKDKKKIDLVIAHHPQGRAYASFHEVMQMQADIFESFGVPITVAEKLVEARKKEVGRRVHAANHHRAVDAAQWLGIPFLCVHTPADNHAATFLQQLIDKRAPRRLKDIMDILEGIEEYKIAARQNVAPMLLFGNPQSRCGKVFVDMTGGTEGPKEILEHLQQAGVGTLVGMHLSEEHYKQLQGKNINVIVAGHVASDNLGMNLILDKVRKISPVKILAFSGFKRVQR
jgi:putative NIF3 family GTP cyclohydrolase 1 type 2